MALIHRVGTLCPDPQYSESGSERLVFGRVISFKPYIGNLSKVGQDRHLRSEYPRVIRYHKIIENVNIMSIEGCIK